MKSQASKIYSLLKKIHLDFMRSILKMKSSTPLVMVYGEFGRLPFTVNTDQNKNDKVLVKNLGWQKHTVKYHLKCIYSCCIYKEIIFIHVNGFCI